MTDKIKMLIVINILLQGTTLYAAAPKSTDPYLVKFRGGTGYTISGPNCSPDGNHTYYTNCSVKNLKQFNGAKFKVSKDNKSCTFKGIKDDMIGRRLIVDGTCFGVSNDLGIVQEKGQPITVNLE